MRIIFLFIIQIIGSILFSTVLNRSYANTRWPEFIAPDKTFLLTHGLIDTASCPPGAGKLKLHASINIRLELCKTFCPGYWRWVGSSTDECHELATQFEFKRYEIQHMEDANGVMNYSIVTALYGDKQQESFSMALTLITVAGERWLCSKMDNATNAIFCSNDI